MAVTKEWKEGFFKALSAKMETYTSDNLLEQNPANGEWILKTMFGTSPEREHFVLVQGVVYPAREDVLMLELYVQLTETVAEGAGEQLREAIEELNSYLPVGLLGVSPADGSVYLRYCFRLPVEKTTQDCVADAVVDYEMMMEVVMAAYPGLSAIWSGEKTFEDVVQAGVLKRYSR